MIGGGKQCLEAPPESFFSRHRFLLVFAALSSLMGTSVGIARVTTSLHAVDLGADARVLGLTPPRRAWASWWSACRSACWSLRVSAILASVALVLLGLGHSLWLVGSASVLLGLSLGTLQIITLTRFAFLGARLGRGKISGITPLVGTCGSLLGSLLGGALGPVLGLQRVFLLFVPCLIGCVAWARLADADGRDLPSDRA